MNAPINDSLGGRRARKRQKTADHLARIAFELFERDGFQAVTMEQIAAAADVARGTLYNHFTAKEALLDHFFRLEFDTGINILLEDVGRVAGLEGKLNRLFDAFSGWAAGRRKYLPYCLDYQLRAGLQRADRTGADALRQVFSTLLTEAQEERDIPDGADIPTLAAYLEHLYFAAILRWLASDAASPGLECRRMVTLFLHGASSISRLPTEELT
jgi:AcrR family transcriptional regulator